jgi:hypothetical protein
MASRKNVAIIMEERGPGIPIDTLAKVIQESGVHANPIWVTGRMKRAWSVDYA